jgi:hypothetical protein
MKRPRGTCPVCGRSVAVRGSGELRDHQGRSEKIQTAAGKRAYAWCPGSGTNVIDADIHPRAG